MTDAAPSNENSPEQWSASISVAPNPEPPRPPAKADDERFRVRVRAEARDRLMAGAKRSGKTPGDYVSEAITEKYERETTGQKLVQIDPNPPAIPTPTERLAGINPTQLNPLAILEAVTKLRAEMPRNVRGKADDVLIDVLQRLLTQ